jgi:hypothetical protein
MQKDIKQIKAKALYSKNLEGPIYLVSYKDILGKGAYGSVHRCYNPKNLSE